MSTCRIMGIPRVESGDAMARFSIPPTQEISTE
jgi:hypothetical protein